MIQDLRIPEEFKNRLKEPLGILISEKELLKIKSKNIIAVGDKITLALLKKKIKPRIAVVDFKIKRKEISKKEKALLQKIGKKVFAIKNPAGFLTLEAWDALEKALASDEPARIEVDGEEDLLAFAAYMLSPEKVKILYGQPSKGIVLMNVSARKKQFYAEDLIGAKARDVLSAWKGKTIILHHNDTDGMCSAAIFLEYLKHLSPVPIATNDVSIHENVKNEILNLKPQNLLVLDLGGEAQKTLSEFSKSMKVLIIDHHKIFDPSFENAIVLNPHAFNVPEELIAPTSYLAYKTTMDGDWIAAVGISGDKGYLQCMEFLGTTTRKYKTDFEALKELLNAADALGKSGECVQEILKAEKPSELESSELLNGLLKEYKAELSRLVEAHKVNAKFFASEKILFYEISSRLDMRGAVANALQILYPRKIIIIGEEEENFFSMSFRTFDVDVVPLIKGAIAGLEHAHGGGHAHAAGCKVLMKDLEPFLERFIDEVETKSI